MCIHLKAHLINPSHTNIIRWWMSRTNLENELAAWLVSGQTLSKIADIQVRTALPFYTPLDRLHTGSHSLTLLHTIGSMTYRFAQPYPSTHHWIDDIQVRSALPFYTSLYRWHTGWHSHTLQHTIGSLTYMLAQSYPSTHHCIDDI